MAAMLKDVVDSIFSPTTKPQAGVVKAMNYSFYALFATLAGLAYATSWNNHVLALSGVAILLFASISWFIAELGKIEDSSKKSDDTTSSTSSSSSNAKRATSAPSQAPGTGSYAEVAAEPPSSSTSAAVNDRSGLTERKTRSSAAQQSSASINGANGKGNDEASYAQVAAEEPYSNTHNAIQESKVGVVEAAGMSYTNKEASASASASASATTTQNGRGAESYAQAAAEEPDAQESVIREDRVGHTETK